MYKIKYFMFFYIIWILYFALAYYILGSEIERGNDFTSLAQPDHSNMETIINDLSSVDDDYSDLRDFFAYIVLSWRNSIGDLSAPSYGSWEEMAENKPGESGIQWIIILIWLHWWLIQFLVLIILLNFLLAMVS